MAQTKCSDCGHEHVCHVDQPTQKDWDFLVGLLWGHVHDWEDKAQQWDGDDDGAAWARRASAQDLRESLELWGRRPEPARKESDQ